MGLIVSREVALQVIRTSVTQTRSSTYDFLLLPLIGPYKTNIVLQLIYFLQNQKKIHSFICFDSSQQMSIKVPLD